MEEITYENVVAQLLKVIPEFHPDKQDVSDGLTHLVFGDLTEFVKSLLDRQDNNDSVQRLFRFIEEAARSNDVRVLDVIKDSFLEGFLDSPDHLHKSKKHMGRFTRRLLRQAKRYVNP